MERAIPVVFAKVLRATALSLSLVWSGSSALGAVAQSAAAQPTKPAKAAAKPTGAKSTSAKSTKTAKPKAAAETATLEIDEVDPDQPISEAVIDIAAWVIATSDNRGLPFAIIDKDAAQVLVFDENGKVRGLAPALIGSAVGDESAPGVGDRELQDIPEEERTTPAGRYLADYGPAAGGKSVLWVDFATSVSIHALQSTRASKKEKRKERLATPEPDDNRITHGCINVSTTFYSKVIRPTFKDGGVFYVLPDSMPVRSAFPGFEPPRSRRIFGG